MMFDINKYKGKYVMHCKTSEEAQDFCNYLHNIGKKWQTGGSYLTRTNYEVYQENTVYYFNKGAFGNTYAAELHEYKILEWSDFMNKEFTKADLKTGDVVLRRNGKVEIVNRELETFITPKKWNDFDEMNEDLTANTKSEYDIVAVRRPCEKSDCQFKAFEYRWGTLIYEREEAEEMTLEEICKALGKEVKIVSKKARGNVYWKGEGYKNETLD